ncbi:MAG: phosphate signaling complex protein PhoU [Candidatus Margulisiibacteriota bacterium]
MLEEKLRDLKKEITIYATHVEEMLDKSIEGLLQRNRIYLEEVIKNYEPLANEKEVRLDTMCTTLIAQFQPAATSLRTILMALKINNDLERMADHAVNIAQSGLALMEMVCNYSEENITQMSIITCNMLKDAVTAFINEDTALSRDVLPRDKKVNALRDEVLHHMISNMARDPHVIEQSLHLIRISGNIERLADLTTNIAEDVIFMVEGKVVKHHTDDKKKGEQL